MSGSDIGKYRRPVTGIVYEKQRNVETEGGSAAEEQMVERGGLVRDRGPRSDMDTADTDVTDAERGERAVDVDVDGGSEEDEWEEARTLPPGYREQRDWSVCCRHACMCGGG